MRINSDEEIKRELYKSYLILVKSLFQQSEPYRLTPQIRAERKRFLVGSILFLAFAMESFINDFGDRYIDDFGDFEKIDSLNKFLIFPKIARENPTEIVTKSEALYTSLKLLFKYRNYFVHYKPTFRGMNTTDERLYSELDHARVRNTYKNMIKLIKKFNNHFEMFIGDEDWVTDYSENINSGTG